MPRGGFVRGGKCPGGNMSRGEMSYTQKSTVYSAYCQEFAGDTVYSKGRNVAILQRHADDFTDKRPASRHAIAEYCIDL